MTLEEKYNTYVEVYFNKLVQVGDGTKQGDNIPGESIANGKIYVGDGTINIANLMQYIHTCNLNKIPTAITIDQCLTALYRLENTAFELYSNYFKGINFPYGKGFFARDDRNDDNISIGGYAGLMNLSKEDPCYSLFVSQDQVWNLNPILMEIVKSDIYSKSTRDKAAAFGLAINKYIKDNNYTIYNPYLSYLNHYFKYMPNTKQSLTDRQVEREKAFKSNIKVKRGANNWYYSGGTKSCVDAFECKDKSYKGSIRTFIHKVVTFTIDKVYEPILGLFNKEFKHNSLNCYAATSGIWWNKNFSSSRANKTNKWLKKKGTFYNWNTDFLIGDHSKIDWSLVKEWLDNYSEPKASYINPIDFMCVYQWYKYHLNNK